MGSTDKLVEWEVVSGTRKILCVPGCGQYMYLVNQ